MHGFAHATLLYVFLVPTSPCLRVFALPTTRYALCGVPLAGVDLGPHDTLFIAEYLFGLCA